ncbi:CheY-like chemotaxis protein [Flavobacterium sp. 2755]|uniref:response regulator n=1 Tax=Flavobacterium sp. 2755 TaxID=2817765 RepID=UPI00285AFBC7|nr:response regulator [Flavobacterium sp. 2755]MDR6764342.1 CheY-like chemotaxis protein [Flavobacterium sp. 2755]
MSQHQNAQRIIYLADDDEDDRVLFLDALQDLNLSVDLLQASDGQQLLNALYDAEHLPEVIFLDINMPGKNGFDCLTEIRNAQGDLKKVKVIMFSTSSSPSNIKLSDELGADFYAVKPSTYKGLKDILIQVLDKGLNKKSKNKKKFLLV